MRRRRKREYVGSLAGEKGTQSGRENSTLDGAGVAGEKGGGERQKRTNYLNEKSVRMCIHFVRRERMSLGTVYISKYGTLWPDGCVIVDIT